MTLEIIVIVALGIMAVYGLVVSTALAAEEDNSTITKQKHFGSPRHIQTKDIEDAGDDKTVAEKDKKNGNDLTVILKLKYSLPGKWYKKVHLDIDEVFAKFYDLSAKPAQIKVKHLEIPEGHSFRVSLNNYLTDDGENWTMHNSICKCPETRTVKVP